MKNLMGLDDVFDRHYCGQAWGEMPAERRHDDRPKNEWMDQELHEIWQAGLGKRLADLAKVVTPGFNVVEGIVGRDGTGFQRGRNFALGMAIAGVNLVAVDSITTYIMGFDPRSIVYLKYAHEAGLGNIDPALLHVYTFEDGQIQLCEDISKLRTPTPFHAIRDIIGDL